MHRFYRVVGEKHRGFNLEEFAVYTMNALSPKVEDRFRARACAKVFFPGMTVNAHQLWTKRCQVPCTRSVFKLNWDSEGQVWQIPYPEFETRNDQKTLKGAVKEVTSFLRNRKLRTNMYHLTELGKPRVATCSISDRDLHIHIPFY